ncbi:hypothetical protein [Megalodesulfovibrio gigas]|uniref:hypothetical protein n=1 Tax=Megalodesulfovibrio gigas TaxID=879 RepID=UPI0003FBA875|nr:hypothetical protein [Megalodesulfovibrio gigas]
MEVEHIFTRAELEAMGQELAKLVVHIEDLEAEKKSHVDHFNSRIKVVEKDSTTLAHRIRRGKEMRTLRCYEVRNFDLNQKQFLEIETREVIKRRPLTEEERQFPLQCKPIPENGRIPQPAGGMKDDDAPPAPPAIPAPSKGPGIPPGWRLFALEFDDEADGTLYVYDAAQGVQAEIAKEQALVFSDLQALEPGDEIRLALPEALARELGFLLPMEDLDAPEAAEAEAHPAALETATA